MKERQWRASLYEGTAAGDEPWPIGPVLRRYDTAGLTIDYRSGLAVRSPTVDELRRFVVSQLPWPVELTD